MQSEFARWCRTCFTDADLRKQGKLFAGKLNDRGHDKASRYLHALLARCFRRQEAKCWPVRKPKVRRFSLKLQHSSSLNDSFLTYTLNKHVGLLNDALGTSDYHVGISTALQSSLARKLYANNWKHDERSWISRGGWEMRHVGAWEITNLFNWGDHGRMNTWTPVHVGSYASCMYDLPQPFWLKIFRL